MPTGRTRFSKKLSLDEFNATHHPGAKKNDMLVSAEQVSPPPTRCWNIPTQQTITSTQTSTNDNVQPVVTIYHTADLNNIGETVQENVDVESGSEEDYTQDEAEPELEVQLPQMAKDMFMA